MGPPPAAPRAALVTGTSTGIGRAAALRLARSGWRVFAGVRRPEDGERLAAEAGGGVTPLSLEVTDETSIERAAAQIEAATGEAGLSGLVNNAGVAVNGALEYLPTEELRRQFEVNVFAPMSLCRALFPLLRRARGRIVNISSGAGRVASPLMGAYCASKFALEALSDALRVELRRAGIPVILVEPGLIRTPFVDKGMDDADRWLAALPESGRAYYGPAVERTRAQIARLPASEPERVARVIERALTAARPRARYTAGRDALLLVSLRRLLPDRALDALFGHLTGL
jgi:NAD(P)-dependent dehydrogenase (short-subunit alcohol dehydrogenase family)